MRSRKEALLIVMESLRGAPAVIAILVGMVVAQALIAFAAHRFASWVDPSYSGSWPFVFMGSQLVGTGLAYLGLHCWMTYRRARHGH